MRLLLDTHVAVWVIQDPSQLPTHVRDIVEDATNPVAVSLVSLWEIAIKFSLGRASAPTISAEQARDALVQMGFDLLDIKVEHVFEVGRLPHHHRDPFDRLLIAQAFAEPMRLVTHDKNVAAYSPTFMYF